VIVATPATKISRQISALRAVYRAFPFVAVLSRRFPPQYAKKLISLQVVMHFDYEPLQSLPKTSVPHARTRNPFAFDQLSVLDRARPPISTRAGERAD
jgi:hypothetical protein